MTFQLVKLVLLMAIPLIALIALTASSVASSAIIYVDSVKSASVIQESMDISDLVKAIQAERGSQHKPIVYMF